MPMQHSLLLLRLPPARGQAFYKTSEYQIDEDVRNAYDHTPCASCWDRACLSSRWGKPKVDEDEGELEKDPEAVDRDKREILPPVADDGKTVPGVDEAVQERQDVRDA